MICSVPGFALSKHLRLAAQARDLPIAGMLELTRRCCFRCVHCYAGPAQDAAGELPTAEWLRLIDEAVAAGVLRLVFTGGEPLLRDDFATLYTHARRAGVAVALFSNAALVDDALIALLQRYPPVMVEVTLYGATAATAAAVTGVASAYERQWRGVERLRAAGLQLKLKAVALRLMCHELEELASRAAAMNLPFRLSTELVGTVEGSTHPAAQQLAAAEAARLEASQPSGREHLRAAMAAREPVDERRYPCRSGLTSFFIDATGELQSCVAVRTPRESVRGVPLLPVWRRVRAAVRQQCLPPGLLEAQQTGGGWLRAVNCPAMLFDNQGRLDSRMASGVEYLARARMDMLEDEGRKGGNPHG